MTETAIAIEAQTVQTETLWPPPNPRATTQAALDATATAYAAGVVASQTAIAIQMYTTPTPGRTPQPTRTPTSAPGGMVPPFDEQLPLWIDDAEADWEALGITSYAIDLRAGGAWTGMVVSLEVRDNAVLRIEARCEPAPASGPNAPCWLENFTARDYAVAGLFDQAQAVAAIPRPMFDPLEFDVTYHFPVYMFYDELNMADEEWFVRVLRFEPR